MIVARTPLRISFAGGGTDFPDFYMQHTGRVISASIDRYVYVILKARFDDSIYVKWSNATEIVSHLDQLEHELVREAMRLTGIHKGIEIVTLADIPSTGSGLGSSSSITVALLHALYVYRGVEVSRERLAREASHIEINILGKPIGIQDQYAAALGGCRIYEYHNRSKKHSQGIDKYGLQTEIFDKNSSKKTLMFNAAVYWSPPILTDEIKPYLILFSLGIIRKPEPILQEQYQRSRQNITLLLKLKSLAHDFWVTLAQWQNLNNPAKFIGSIIHDAWILKRQLASGISSDWIDNIYNLSRDAGAIGGKILGAGGGGHFLFIAPPSQHDNIRAVCNKWGLSEVPFNFESTGSQIIL